MIGVARFVMGRQRRVMVVENDNVSDTPDEAA